MIALQLFLNIFYSHKVYAKDNVDPVINCSVYSDKSSGKLKMKIAVTDNNEVKMIKYAVGNHRISFFKNSFYTKKISNVSLTSAKKVTTSINVKKDNIYTVYAVDKAGNSTIKRVRVKINSKTASSNDKNNSNNNNNNSNNNNDKNSNKDTNNNGNNITDTKDTKNVAASDEVRAVWITFLEFSSKGYTESDFVNYITKMFDKISSDGMNQVYVHVRPFSDAMYRSAYFPWSKYVSGKQGVDPGFDPLKIMVDIAHARNLKIHAYINPYRVSTEAEFDNIAVNSPAYKWLNDDDEDNDRNVLKFGNMYYYNPSSSDVIKLINNGVAEIVNNYDVDGIIFDDYFYPSLGSNYSAKFDAKEYKEYESNTTKPMSIVDWRRNNINQMVQTVYTTVKNSGSNRTFGISPAGNLNNLRANDKYYVDIDRWGSETGFVDYIAPQQYWGFEHSICPFEDNVNKWMAVVKNPDIKLYVALPMHLAQAQETDEWKNNHNILGKMVTSLRNKSLKGFSIYRYAYMTEQYLKKNGAMDEYNNLKNVIKNK